VDGAVFQETLDAGQAGAKRKIIVHPTQKAGKPLATKELVDQRRLLPLLAIEIVDNPVAKRPLRTYFSAFTLYVLVLGQSQTVPPSVSSRPDAVLLRRTVFFLNSNVISTCYATIR